MYGKGEAGYPRRVVCLSAEHVEICYALGAGERVVGVPGTAHRPPEAREKPKVGGFTSFRVDKIRELEPDLVLAFSDLQAEVSAELIRAGLSVFCSNPRSLGDVLDVIVMVGGLLGLDRAARDLVQDMQDEIRQVREFSSVWPDRPRVYFEEWHDPLIAGIRWISELIEIAGGRDVFAELRDRRGAQDRIVLPETVRERDPQIILASWCGKPVETASIATRAGWDRISAVKAGEIHELEGADILSPGPSLMVGLRRIHEIIQGFQARR
jgi:iron complex transport system substrate-binding protein